MLQGLHALFVEGARELMSAAGEQVEAGHGDNAEPTAWPISWGAAGEVEADSPYGPLFAEDPTPGRRGVPQTLKQLPADTPAPPMPFIFSAMGEDFMQGMELFQRVHTWGTWRVPIPDFEDEVNAEGPAHRVPIHAPRCGYIHQCGVLMLRLLKEYVVRSYCIPESMPTSTCALAVHVTGD